MAQWVQAYTHRKLCSLLELHHQIKILLIRFTALAFIILQYFSIIAEMLSCMCCNRDLLQPPKGRAMPKLCFCKQGRDHERKATKKRDICTLTLWYPQSVSKSASGVTVSKQDSKPLHLAEEFWEARLPRKSWKELLQHTKMKLLMCNKNRL